MKVHCRSLTIDKDVDLAAVARMTDGKNGADLRAICMEAGMFAIRKERPAIMQADFLAAIAKVGLDFHRGPVDVEGAMFA
jgi:proteasome regulatory subunit